MFKLIVNDFKKRVCNEQGTFAWIAVGTAVVAGGFTAYSDYQQGAAQKA